MDAVQVGGGVLIVGSVVFLVGAAVGVPRVFREPDPEVRLRLIQARPGAWRAAQPLYALGALVTAAGAGVIAAATSGGVARAAFAVSCAALAVGALAWTRSVYLRGADPRAFAYGELPGWPFVSYVLLTVAGLAALGVGLLAGGSPAWLGWLTIGADVLFLAAYLRLGDIPPFVFYLLLILVGAFAG